MNQSNSLRAHRLPRDRSPAAQRASAARKLCRQALACRSPLELERWTSSLLGHLWRRAATQSADGVDPLWPFARPWLQSFAEVGGRDAKTALRAVAQIDRGRLGLSAGELAASAGEAAVPDWIGQVGTATITRAFSDRSPGDGEALLLETDQVGEAAHMLGVFIADRLGGMATALALTRVLDPLDTSPKGPDVAAGRSMRFRRADPVLARRRALVAIERTDSALYEELDENFADHRALAIARIKPRRCLLSS